MKLIKLLKNDSIIEKFSYFDNLEINAFIKREDKNDAIGSGVKLRQIQEVLNYAKRKKISNLIIDGMPNSNCLTALSVYAKNFDLSLDFIIKGVLP